MDESEYSIHELSKQSGLPRRTIHFYTQQGVLPPPTGAGLGARYNEEHRLRLLLVPHLRRRGLRLDDIRKKFEQQSMEDLEHLAIEVTPQTDIILERRPEPSPQPGTTSDGQNCNRYDFGSGVTILIPDTDDPARRRQFERLLMAANRILQWI
jgi:DNA-binding transcriptional MerR regulator